VRRVVWIGGGTGSGKSSTAHVLASRHGWRLFRIDDRWYAHAVRLAGERLTPDEQWLGQTPQEQAAEWEAQARQKWPLVLEDLERLPASPGTIVEGPSVLPDVLPDGAAAVFLRSSEAFQRAVLERRPLPPTADPEQALRNRIEKDRLFAETLARSAGAHGFPVVTVDGSRTPAQIAADIEAALAISWEGGAYGEELSAVRRWQNQVFAENIRTWLASVDAHAGADEAEYPFVCECGQQGCAEVVHMTVQEQTGSVIGH
jgi:hypothetical protein